MKYLVTAFLLIFWLNGFSQIYVKPNNTYGTEYNRLKPKSTMLVPTFCGVPNGIASLQSTNQGMSGLYFDSCGRKMYLFVPKDSTWKPIGSVDVIDTSIIIRVTGANFANDSTYVNPIINGRLPSVNYRGIGVLRHVSEFDTISGGGIKIKIPSYRVAVNDYFEIHLTGSAIFNTSGGYSGITLLGDVTGSGSTTITTTLANSGVVAGTYGSAVQVPRITVDAKGRITGVTLVTITGGGGGGGTATWGGIVGSLSDQLDLRDSLRTRPYRLIKRNDSVFAVHRDSLSFQFIDQGVTAGVVLTTTNQTIAGQKTFTDTLYSTKDIVINDGAGRFRVGRELVEALSTGLYSGGNLTIGSPTSTYSIAAGDGHVINNTIKRYKAVEWTASNSRTPSISSPIVHVLVDSNGVFIEQSSFPTREQQRSQIYLGYIAQQSGTVIGTSPASQVVSQPVNQLYDYLNAFGAFNVSGNTLTANGANMNVNKSAGSIFKTGSNFQINPNDPHVRSQSAATPITFQYLTSAANSSTGVNTTTVLGGNYDLAGVITAIPGSSNQATIQRVWLFPSGTIRVQYGAVIYNSLSNAIAAVPTEIYTPNPSVVNNAILLGFIVVTKGATALNDPAQARIIQAPRFGEAQASAGTGVNWGNIGGTLNNQIDLRDSLLARVRYADTSVFTRDADLAFELALRDSIRYITVTTSTTLVDSMFDKRFKANVILVNSSSATTITVPSGLNIVSGQFVQVSQVGTGQVTIAASGTTLNAPFGALKTTTQYSEAIIRRTTTANTYRVMGDLVL